MQTSLYENKRKPIHSITGAEYDETAVSTDFRVVYETEFVVSEDMYRIFEPTDLVTSLPLAACAREYIVEVSGTGFFNLHQRIVVGVGHLAGLGEQTFCISNGLMLPYTLLPEGCSPAVQYALAGDPVPLWPVTFAIGYTDTNHATENVVFLPTEWYYSENMGVLVPTVITFSYTMNTWITSRIAGGYFDLSNEDEIFTAEFINKMTCDHFTHRFYGMGTSLGISKVDENVTVKVRILRRTLVSHSLTVLNLEQT